MILDLDRRLPSRPGVPGVPGVEGCFNPSLVSWSGRLVNVAAHRPDNLLHLISLSCHPSFQAIKYRVCFLQSQWLNFGPKS